MLQMNNVLLDERTAHEWCREKLELLRNGTHIRRIVLKVEISRLNKSNEDRNTILHYASRFGCLRVVELLIRHGANVNAKNRNNDTPLIFALKENKVRTALMLKHAGAKFDNFDEYELMMLYVVEQGYYHSFEFLCGFNYAERIPFIYNHRFHRYLLHWVVMMNNNEDSRLRIARRLINGFRARINATTIDNDTPLHLAVQSNLKKVAQLLLNQNAKPNEKNASGLTPLWVAVTKSSEDYNEMIELLLENGCSVDTKNSQGLKLIHYAVVNSKPEVVRLLLNHQADVNDEIWVDHRDLYDFDAIAGLRLTPLSYCILERSKYYRERLQIMYMNLQMYTDFDRILDRHFEQIVEDQIDITKILLKNGAEVNFRDYAVSPLYITANTEVSIVHSDILKLLLKYGATFDCETDVIYSILRCNIKTSRFLIKRIAKEVACTGNNEAFNFRLTRVHPSLQGFFNICKNEIEHMKIDGFVENYSVFNLLKEEVPICYLRGSEIQRLVLSYRHTFPLYYDALKDNYYEKIKRSELYSRAIMGMSYLFNWDHLNVPHILDLIAMDLPIAALRSLEQI